MRKATLSEIRDEMAEVYARCLNGQYSTKNDWNVADHYKDGFDAGVTEFSKLLKAKVEYHAEAYGTDIFPEDSTSLDAHAAKMGRHMCKVFLEYIEECK